MTSTFSKRSGVDSFAIRLRDVLSTLESASIIGAVENRMRGLGEQLQYACLSLPCDEALVALELSTLGRLMVPGVASADVWRKTDLSFLPSGTPFAYLLGGGSGYSAQIDEDDDMLAALAPVLESEPRHAIFVPIRVGSSVLGGVALLRADAPGDEELAMAERLAEVLSLTLESHRSERVLISLFATVLPDLTAVDAPTDFAERLDGWVHRMRIAPEYRRRLELAEAIGRIAAHGEHETVLASEVLQSFESYIKRLASGRDEPDEADDQDLLTDDLYD
jgi:hypothetical protein